MQFSILKLAVATLAVCSDAVLAQTTPAQVVTNIQTITTKSQNLIPPAQSINIISGSLFLIGQGPFPPIIVGFADIVQTTTGYISQMASMPPVTDATESTAIFEAFREFVRVHQVLLNVLIGKAGLFRTVPFIGQPVASALSQVEGVVDQVALGLIAKVQSRADDLTAQANSLSQTLKEAKQAYSGIIGGTPRRSAEFREALRV